MNLTSIYEEARIWSLASLSGLRIQRCHEPWCRLQTWLGSHIAVAVVQARSYSSDQTPILGTSICFRYSPKRTKKEKKKKRRKQICPLRVKTCKNPVIIMRLAMRNLERKSIKTFGYNNMILIQKVEIIYCPYLEKTKCEHKDVGSIALQHKSDQSKYPKGRTYIKNCPFKIKISPQE